MKAARPKPTQATARVSKAPLEPGAGTRDRLLNVAAELILARSYGAVSVEDVCEKAGARKGSFYHFFKSKRDLVLEVLDRRNRECHEILFIPAFRTGLPPIERIRRAFDILCELEDQEYQREGQILGCFAGNIALEMGTQDEKIRKKAREFFESFAGYFEEALRDAVAAGEVKHPDVRIVARQMVAYLEGAILMAKTYNDPVLFHDLCEGALVLATQEVARHPSRKHRHPNPPKLP